MVRTAKAPTFDSCTVLRRMEIRHGVINMRDGSFIEGATTIIVRECATPLFHDADRATGMCGGCRSGWSVSGSVRVMLDEDIRQPDLPWRV